MADNKNQRPGHVAPEGYDSCKYDKPSVACDVVITTFKENRLKVLLIERANNPYKGYWALPGGFVEIDESLEAAASREVLEETGLSRVNLIPLEPFGDPERDPRTRVISVSYLAIVRAHRVKPKAGDDAGNVEWHNIARLPDLAFDHDKIIAAARERLREIAILTPRLFDFLPRVFSRGQFRQLCREVMGRRYDAEAFYMSMDRSPGFKLEEDLGGEDSTYRYDKSKFNVGDFMFLLME